MGKASRKMDLAIPSDLPTLSVEEERKLSVVAVRGTHEECELAGAAEYFEKRNVVGLINTLLTDLFAVLPEDPIDHMMKFMLRSTIATDHRDVKQLGCSTSAAVTYSNEFKLPHLFDELLTAVLHDRPEDCPRFALSWFRWNKQSFVARHKPDGYRSMIDTKDGTVSPTDESSRKQIPA